MQKLLVFFSAILLFAACSKYDDVWIKDEIASIEKRLAELEEKCKQINADIVALQNLVNAIQQNDFVADVKEIKENGKVIGYEICFSKSKSVCIYNGHDGIDGHTPQISVKQDTDGVWYWTIDGEWMRDAKGNKVSTLGREDLVPQMKIENEYWYISYDNGVSWTKLSKAVGENGKDGENGKSYFQDVESDDEYVYITLMDGTTLKMPKKSDLDITFEQLKDIPCNPRQILQIPYTLSGVISYAEIITICEGKWTATINKKNETSGYIVVNVPDVVDDSHIVVAVSDNRKVVMKTLSFAEGVFSISDSFVLSDNGGELTISLSTNYEYEVSTNAPWISSIKTRAIRNDNIVIKYNALPANTITRSAEIVFKNSYLGVIKTITLVQGNPISLSSKTLQLIIGEESNLKASSLLGHNSFVWYSSNSNIVRVDASEKLTAIAKGSATITAMTSDYIYSAQCSVSVYDIDDLVSTQFGSATNLNYSNGVVGAGTKLSWYIYNHSSTDIVVNAIQLIDAATGNTGNKMSVNETLKAGKNVGWVITLGTSIKAPCCRFYFTYKGKEYTQDCDSIFK